ncbi:MAG: PEP-CTERM sorting domain-containing protein [Thiomicrorhabdus sp.]|nr:PEP-CTERM sorting domain-containing protein [Thiomicrorhabdus sp.]
MKSVFTSFVVGLFLLGSVGMVLAAPMSGFSDFDSGYTLLNFDELATGTVVDDEYSSLGLTVSGTTGDDGTGTVADVIAHAWDPIYIGNQNISWDGSVIFTFDSSVFVSQFGLNIVDSFDNWLSVYDASNNLLESVIASGPTTEGFYGIDTGSVGIAYAIVSGDFFSVDDVAFNASATAPVPEPSTILLLGSGLLGLGWYGRKRKKA